MTEHTTTKPRWPLPAGLLIALVLFGLPLALALWIGWPGVAPLALDGTTAGPLHPLIIPPAPPAGLPPDLILWILLSGGLSLGFALGAWPLVLWFGRVSGIESNMPRLRSHLLAVLGLASLLAYVLNFLLPFPLERYYNLALVSMGRIADYDAGVALATTAATVALFLLYGLACWLCRGQSARGLWMVVLVGAMLLALVNFFVVSATSTDVYDNVVRGRITGVYNGNPYVVAPADYPFEPFTEYISWDDATSAYGPLWETLGAFLGRLAGDRLWPNVLAQKLLALAGYLLSTALIAAILRRIAPDRALAGTLLFAWNPLVLMEGPANAHNDLLMIALFLGAFWFLIQRTRAVAASSSVNAPRPPSLGEQPAQDLGRGGERDLLYGGVALILLTAAVLVKFVPALFFPFFLLYLLVPERTWRRRLGLGVLLLVPAALLVVQYYAVFWEWPAVVDTFARRAEMFRMSIPSAAVDALRPNVGEEAAMSAVREPFLWAFVLCYLGVLVRAALALARSRPPCVGRTPWARKPPSFVGRGWGRVGCWPRFHPHPGPLPHKDHGPAQPGREPAAKGVYFRKRLGKIGRILFGEINKGRPIDVLLRACLITLLLYLLLANFWFWPWYLVWPFALLALLGDERLLIPLILAGCAGELAHVAWNFLWYWWGITWDTTYQMDVLIVFGLTAPALLAYMVLGLRRRGNHLNTTPHTDTHDVPCPSAGQRS